MQTKKVMANVTEEIWKDVIGYEGIYKVSSFGRVKSRYRIRKLDISKDGYGKIQLDNRGKKSFSIHRLVACAFIPNPDNKPCVNHLDRNRLNNNVSNLEWCTHYENVLHSSVAKLRSEDVIEIRKLISPGDSLASISKKYNVSKPCIRNIKSGLAWSLT